jgi:hypothetical protein
MAAHLLSIISYKKTMSFSTDDARAGLERGAILSFVFLLTRNLEGALP